MTLHIATREFWGLEDAKEEIPSLVLDPATDVYLIGMKSSPCYSFRHCQNALMRTYKYHMETQMQADIRYNFIIGGDGTVYEGRGWHAQPSLPYVYNFQNRSSVLIGFVGDYRTDNLPLRLSDIAAKLVDYGIAQKYIDKMFIFHDILTFTYFRQYHIKK